MNTLSLVHAHLQSWIHSGDFVIDATAGNGKDTEFLCGLVGREGKSSRSTIPGAGGGNTKKRLAEHGWSEVGQVVLDSHANMGAYAQENSVDCIVFNLGWLPAETTRYLLTRTARLQPSKRGLSCCAKTA